MPSVNGRRWCFTHNNYDFALDPTGQHLFDALPAGVAFVVWQHERGERDHLQGYLRTSNSASVGQVKRILGDNRVHLERAQGSEAQGRAYCIKEDTRVDGPWEFGVPLVEGEGQGSRTDLAEVVAALKAGKGYADLIDSHPAQAVRYSSGLQQIASILELNRRTEERDIKITVLCGPTAIGKSHFAWRYGDAQGLRSYKMIYPADPHHAFFFPNYRGEEVLICDEWACQIGVQVFNSLMDKYPAQVRTGTATYTWARWTHVLILSNLPVAMWWDAAMHPPAVIAAFKRRITNLIDVPDRTAMPRVWAQLGLPPHPDYAIRLPSPPGSRSPSPVPAAGAV